MNTGLWELPHWMHWLAGVLVAEDFTSLALLDFYSSQSALTGIDRAQVGRALAGQPADVYLFSPMTPNLHLACEIAGLIKAFDPKSVTILGASSPRRFIVRSPVIPASITSCGIAANTRCPPCSERSRGKRASDAVGNVTYAGTKSAAGVRAGLLVQLRLLHDSDDQPQARLFRHRPRAGGDSRLPAVLRRVAQCLLG